MRPLNTVLAPLGILATEAPDGTPLSAALAALSCAAIPILPDEDGSPRYGILPGLPRLLASGLVDRYGLALDYALADQAPDESVADWLARRLPALFRRFADPAEFGAPLVLSLAQVQALQAHPAYRVMAGQYESEADLAADLAALGLPPNADLATARALLREAMAHA